MFSVENVHNLKRYFIFVYKNTKMCDMENKCLLKAQMIKMENNFDVIRAIK